MLSENIMSVTGKKDGCFWPMPDQELLLKAALMGNNKAAIAWSEWRSHIDIDDIDNLDPGSYRLLPLLYRNLNSLGVKDPILMKLKGVYRLTWYKNQMLFHIISGLLRSFNDAGIESMVLKGAALILLCYGDYGLRPMNDFDILVPTEHALPAIRLLRKLGWNPVDFEPDERYISVSYSHGFEDKAGRQCDLHWHLFSQCRDAHADDEFWERTVSTEFHGVPARVLCLSDQLLHICVHGAHWNITPPFRWVADAIMLLNKAPDGIDWNRLIEQAQKRRLILPLQDTLNYLSETFDVQIDPEVLKRLQEIYVPGIERMEYRIAVNPPTPWTAMLDLWCQHSRLKGNVCLPSKMAGFPAFLQKIWGVSLWQLPFHGLSKTLSWQRKNMQDRFTR